MKRAYNAEKKYTLTNDSKKYLLLYICYCVYNLSLTISHILRCVFIYCTHTEPDAKALIISLYSA